MQNKTNMTDCIRAAGLDFIRNEHGLGITNGTMVVRGDFSHMKTRIAPNVIQRELLVRAAHIKDIEAPTAIDATAGLGEDALLLAAAGFTVTLYERNPVIFALLSDALTRAAATPKIAHTIERMTLIQGDSIVELPHITASPDVILLDPMFPIKQKSAAAKKKLQLLQLLEQPCKDERMLLEAAMAAQPRKIIIKRPLKGSYLAGHKPNYSLTGKMIRYDCIILNTQ